MWTAAAFAAGPEAQGPLTRTEFHSTAISWQPLVAYETAVLTVSGPDDTFFRREFPSGEPIVFNVTNADVAAVGNGLFAYELRFVPVLEPEVREILRTAREHDHHAIEVELRRQGKIPDRDLVQSGAFTVLNGTLTSPELEEMAARGAAAEPGADARRLSRSRTTADGATREPVDASDAATDAVTKDQVILDDLIVDGSLCVGMDCVNGESFGFDTIRLKENNLRIRFQDTSSTASFPTRDWQITANDSANGGANKFSIDDIDGGRTPLTIEANAPSNALYVDDGGRLGLGTAIPVVDVHPVNGNTPTLRLEQNGSSGFTAQTWDVAGNEANFFIRDATNGSALPFRIQPGSAGDSLYIKPSGVEVNASFSAGSDVNMKTGLVPVDPRDTLEKVAQLPVTTWSFKDDPSGSTHFGPNAQDFHRTFALGPNDRHIAPLDAAGVALAAIQGLNTKLVETETVRQRHDEDLEGENAMLAERLADVEKQNQELADRLAELERLLATIRGPLDLEP
jgi:hypothetical protein